MQHASMIHEAARRIDEATAVYRFKARQAVGEYEELGGRWTDSRSKSFHQRYVQPQRDAMDEGHRLCRQCSDLATSASSHAQQSEDAIIRFFAHAEAFESSAVEFARFAEKTSQLSSHVVTQVQGLTAQINEITSSISSVMQDPG